MIDLMETRRHILQLIAGCAGVAFAGIARTAKASRDRQLGTAIMRVAHHLARHRVSHIGEAYLTQNPQEAEASCILDLLLRGSAFKQLSAAGGGPTDQGAFEEAIRRDFARGHILDVDGWRLSKTEARLCALAYLSSTNRA